MPPRFTGLQFAGKKSWLDPNFSAAQRPPLLIPVLQCHALLDRPLFISAPAQNAPAL